MAVSEKIHESTLNPNPRTVSELTEQNVATIAQLEATADAKRSRTDIVADHIAHFCGSMNFVWLHLIWFAFWIGINTWPNIKHVDPFPFQFMTLVVALETIFLTTIVMISQNRQSRLAERRNHLDLQINLLAEQENSKMLTMLRALMEHAGIAHGDPEVRMLQEATKPEKLVEQIELMMDKSFQTPNADSHNENE